ncbi:NAD-dependent epimerase/dehydratase family protein [Paenibacillus spongiae]|uniref:NAD-dependent epimerase/dehydratase family protein n=1 Tax=Paenibacillus spongiae TaxID=2909671 RepID=A0ABY5SEW3_9BACL|nr:NAD-dependent epimerase/dehydratase family protein [Paenibacillus spongiae]UVI31255.1 NAD-dependent epimerase/dehydratase family protein [Paenibacillus spongiae]
MKVLITGGYGFIGSHVADRFHKEGYEVYIIDNLTTGKLENVTFKHKGYHLAVEDSKCEEIFQANQFDTVVHLAAQASVNTNPQLDSESNVLGLVNILNLSQKFKVKKFVFASSAAVYGTNEQLPLTEEAECDPISPYGISKWVGESYCLKWQELYGLDTACFRFSNVYGPRQSSSGEGGVISIFMNRVLSEQQLYVFGDGNQTRDFIYVEDVADAIFRMSYSNLSGIYNLSTNKACSVNAIIETIGGLHAVKGVTYTDKRPGDITHSILDNARVKHELDWAPMYGIEEGLQRTYGWFEQKHGELESAASSMVESKPSAAKQWLKKYMPYGENLLAFILTAWLSLTQITNDYSAIDIKLFYITIIGIMYGSRQSILAVVLSIGLFVYQKLLDGREFISLLYDTDVFFQIAIYLFIGLVVGYAIERKNAIIQATARTKDELEERYDFLNGMYREVREVKDELQLRILNSGDSFGKIYSITKELESLEPETVFNSTVNVVKSIMAVESVAIYSVNPYGTYMRMIAHSNDYAGQAAKSLRVDEHSSMQWVLREGNVFVNKELDSSAPLMIAPIFYNGEIKAVITIDGMAFHKFSLYYQNLFKVTSELVSSALTRAFAYIEATESQRYVTGTPILRKEAFASILESKRLARMNHSTPYLVLISADGTLGVEDYSEKIAGMLRETDYIGLNEDEEIVILLSNTGEEDAGHVLNRFASRGLPLHIVEAELQHD